MAYRAYRSLYPLPDSKSVRIGHNDIDKVPAFGAAIQFAHWIIDDAEDWRRPFQGISRTRWFWEMAYYKPRGTCASWVSGDDTPSRVGRIN